MYDITCPIVILRGGVVMDETTIKFTIYSLVFLCIICLIIPIVRTTIITSKIKKLADNTLEITPDDFFKIRNASNGGRGRKHISTSNDFTGVYILYNQTKRLYYVGQGKSVFTRVNAHFTGHGNGDVYADYKYGDKFTIKMIDLKKSGFDNINELQRSTIKTYDAFSKGYNRTRGNK